MDVLKSIKEKFAAQKKDAVIDAVCPHCGKPIDFKFSHVQTTEVTTTLVEIAKKGEFKDGGK